jgi:hypothetical protein
MATTYVSFLVKSPTDPVDPQQRIEWLKPLLALDIDLVLCVDSFYVKLVPSPFPKRLRILLIEMETFETYKQIHAADRLRLPTHRNQTKDTMDYMAIQNLKPELLKAALHVVYTPFVAYLDAGISKICKNPATLKALETYRFKDIPLVLLPGCHTMPAEPPSLDVLAHGINWTFCGGFFIVPSHHVETLYEAHKTALQRFLDRGLITWEVNVWTSYMPTPFYRPNVVWFAADHNDSMIAGVPRAYLEPAAAL